MTTKPKALKFRIRRAAPLSFGVPEGEHEAPFTDAPPATGQATAPATALAITPAVSPVTAKATAPVTAPVTAPRAATARLAGTVSALGALRDTIRGTSPNRPRPGAAATAPGSQSQPGAAASLPPAASPAVAGPTDPAAIRAEGLTGRQLRMARRVAQKHGITVTSDFDAVQQLRVRGIDPFERSGLLQLVQPDPDVDDDPLATAAGRPADPGQALGRIQLPQTMPQGPQNLPSTERINPAERRATEITKIQRDLALRRRKKMALLFARLTIFVTLPTLIAGWYFYVLATPMYATKSEFVIQMAESTGAAGLGGLFQGTSMATQQDSITVQSYLTSRAALMRLDTDHDFKAHFSQEDIDPIQRLDPAASNEDAYAMYQDHVRISYDPTEGIVKMEVIAADPQTSQTFSEALISYAEEQVDQLTQRLREDQMAGARASYEAAEVRRSGALATWLQIQQEVQQIDPIGETSARTQQISALETERQQLQLELQTRLSVTRPNQAQVEALRSQIAGIEGLIASLRSEMTEVTAAGNSLASKNTELRLAEENYTFQTVLVQQALTQMEAAQIEANRQVRYLSLGVEPVAPDEATYPRAFENTILAFLIFAGIYLMISLTASILREQVVN